MQKKIQKHLKVTSCCTNCETPFKRNAIVTVDKGFSIASVSAALLSTNKIIQECLRCGASIYNVSYTFYHEEKIKING